LEILKAEEEMVSRRQTLSWSFVLADLAIFSLASRSNTFANPKPIRSTDAKQTLDDSALVRLGHQFDVLATQVDQAIEGTMNIEWRILEELGRVELEIMRTPASTLEGFCTKARVACWSLLGDLDQSEEADAYDRMALSIVRDLTRLHGPDLERPGALKKLVES